MRKNLLIGTLAAFLLIGGTIYATTTPTQIIVQPVKKTMTEMEKKRENRQIAKTFASVGFDWRGKEWRCLESLWTRESRFDSEARNPNSSARGIGQMLREQSSDPRIQVLRSLKYISVRYKNPCRAKSFHDRKNWY